MLLVHRTADREQGGGQAWMVWIIGRGVRADCMPEAVRGEWLVILKARASP